MNRRVFALAASMCACAAALGCSRGAPPASIASPPNVSSTEAREVAGTALGDAHADGHAGADHVIGAPATFENLTVFPITSDTDVDLGPITTLEAALHKQEAEVREVGADRPEPVAVPDPAPLPQPGSRSSRPRYSHHAPRQSGPQVNALVIENKGSIPIYVLAGTVVKGGNQDRQIAQDFVIEPHQTASVDAFCVEHGRWSAQRDGHATEGKFDVGAQLVTSQVRAAGQYKQNQGEVWAKVADVNASNRKSAASGTLLATLDDGEVAKHRAALVGKMSAFLKGTAPGAHLVGVAYAVDGQVRGARWFANHAVFDLFRETLANTAAVDAITAGARRDPGAPPPATTALTPAAVDAFITSVDAAASAVRASTSTVANENEYRESAKGYGSVTRMKASAPSPAAAGAPPASPKRAVPLSHDYLGL